MRTVFLDPRLRMSALAETLLVNASRAQLVGEVIRPALAAGAVVLCDRYVHSTLAYQSFGRGLPLQLVRSVCDAADGGLMPDLAILINVSYETSRARLSQRGSGDRLEQEDEAFHRRVRAGFKELAQRDPSLVAIDGERSQEAVAGAVLAALSPLLA